MEEYRRYTKPAELHKAINTLRGLISGVTADKEMSEAEAMEVSNWLILQSYLRDRHPFSELIPMVEAALADGVISTEEREDILWLCSSFTTNGDYYDVITSGVQFLSGLVYGMLADGELSDNEISLLKDWLDNNDYLAGVYPYDELTALVTAIMADNAVSADERNILKAFIGNLIDFSSSYNLHEPDFKKLREEYSVAGICALCPEVEFVGRSFCFTGEANRPRSEMEQAAVSLGGELRKSVSSKTDYLVVGHYGNPCWAFSCYGRKIEEAINVRKAGGKVQIIDENDFWDAVADATA